ncbi:MAG: ABC transporter permease, partial [Acidobacteriota bacterium]
MTDDLRAGFRGLLRHPSHALLAVTILAIGIGLTTAMFSIVYGIVLRGLPIERADELMHLEARHVEEGDRQLINHHQFVDWRAGQSTFDELHAYRVDTMHIAGDGYPERLDGARITPGAFAHLGIRPLHGREFDVRDAEAGAEPVALVSHALWARRFGSDLSVLGRRQRIGGQATVIVGIMPEGFQFPTRQDVWIPLALDLTRAERVEDPPVLHTFGRLRSGVELDTARADLGLVISRLASQFPSSDGDLEAVIEPYGQYFVDSGDVEMAWTSLGAVFLVLLIACFNVANLLLSRAASRSKEFAMRAVLGADRWRLVRQTLAESFALAALASALGVGLATLLIRAFNVAVADQEWPFWFDVRIDWPSLAFVVASAVLVTLVAGIAPAWRSARTAIVPALQSGARSTSRSRLRSSLVVAEIVLSCVLLVGAGLMVRTLINLGQLDFHFDADRLYAGRVDLDSSRYPDRDSVSRTWTTIETRLAARPEIEHVAITDRVPGSEWAPMRSYVLDGEAVDDSERLPTARRTRVSSGFFAALDADPLAGRVFESFDRQDAPRVVVVNRSFARRYGEDGSVVGRRLRFPARNQDESPWWEIVGVVPDLHAGGPKDVHPEAIYVPLEQSMSRAAVLLVRTRHDVDSAIEPIRSAVAATDPDLPVYFAGVLATKISQQLFFYRLIGGLFSIMAI